VVLSLRKRYRDNFAFTLWRMSWKWIVHNQLICKG